MRNQHEENAVRTEESRNEAFSSIVEEYSDLAYNVAFRILHNHQDSEEAVQDAFLSAYRAFDSFEGRSKVSTWLYRIVVNTSLMKIRKNGASLKRLSQAQYDGFLLPNWDSDPERSAANGELREAIAGGLGQLIPEQRVAIVLKDVQQLSNEEAAQVLAISVPAFKSRLHRGRIALRDYLDKVLED